MPKLLPKAHAIAQQWLNEVRFLVPDEEELLIEVHDRASQKNYIKTFIELKDKLSLDEPIVASRIHISPMSKGEKLFIVLKMLSRSPLIGYIRKKDGTVERTTVAVDPARKRKIKLMVSDGLSVEEINNALESPLTRAEIREHIERGRFT